MSFLSQLDRASYPTVEKMICVNILKKHNALTLKTDHPSPEEGHYKKIEGYWVPLGSEKPHSGRSYVVTDSVKRNLKDLARLASAG